ncbi:MAG TPA: SDR family oxidoreductase, partial [Rhodospirillales bacterium]|nr:SDR family oxidoreductase [Rhodospirillales bacterium]
MGYIVISASSDIGAALSRRWVEAGIDVVGTYRQKSQSVTDLEGAGVRLVECDLGDRASIKDAISSLCNLAPRWDALIIAPGTLDPIGKFDELDFDQWELSVSVNFVAQMRLLHGLLGGRRRDHS